MRMIFLFFFTRYSSNLASNNKRVDLFDGPAEDNMEENVLLASSNPFYLSSPFVII